MGERLWLHTAAHLRFYRRSRIVLGVGLAIVGLWSLTMLPLFFGGSAASRFNQLRGVAAQLTTLGWLLSAALGLYVTSSHLRNRTLQVILTRPGSPQLWLASVFTSALLVAAAMQAIGAVVTLVLSLAWGVPYQIGFLYMAVNGVFQAAIVIAMLTTLGAVLHPVLAFLVFVLFNENTFQSLRFGVELLKAQNHGGWVLDLVRPLVIGIHTALPMQAPFETQTAAVVQSMRVTGTDWGYLLATAAYSLAITTVCFLLAEIALRRRSFATTT
jgi:ABC-type transport system involved in multi-copper enzyme maturation permease subunit